MKHKPRSPAPDVGANVASEPFLASARVLRRPPPVSAEKFAKARENVALYRLFFQSNPMPAWVFDEKSLRFLAVNEAAIQCYGYSREEFLKMTVKDIRPAEDIPAYLEYLAASAAGRPEPVRIWKHCTRKKETLFVETLTQPVLLGKRPACLVLANDVTERKRTEDRLRRSEKSLANAQRMARIGNWDWDIEADELYWSEQVYQLFGVAQTEFGGRYDAFLQGVHPDDRERVDKMLESALAGSALYDVKHRVLLPDGSIRLLRELGEVTRDDDGNPVRMTGTVQDITEAQLAEQGLQKEREFLAALVENVTDGIVACDAAGVISLFNGATREFHGLPAEPVAPDDWAAHFDLYLPDGITPMPKEQIPLYRTLHDGPVQDLEMIIAPRNGKVRRILASGRAFRDAAGERAGAVVVMHDVTERFVAAEALRQSEAALARSQRMARLGSWEIDLVDLDDIDGNPLQWSDEAFRIFGRQPLAATVKTAEFFEQVHPDDRERVSAAFKQMFENGADYHLDHRILLPDGSERVVHEQAALVLDPKSKRPVKVIGTVQDITERERAEAQVRLQASMIDLAHDAIVLRDLDNRVELWNRGAETLYGWTVEEVRGRRIEDFLYSDPKPFLIAQQSVLRDGDWTGELKELCKDGRTVTVRCRWTLLKSDAGEPHSVLAIKTDVTERKALEAQFMRAQRLESIGTLASGVAHDLNNILSPILMSVPLLRTPLSDESREKLLSLVEQSAERGAAVVKQVLTFARGADGEKVLVQPTYLVKEIAQIAEETFPTNITVRGECPDDLWLVTGDPTELHQVLLNLCVNARDAMPEGGSLSIKAENFDVDAPYASMTPGAHAGPHVLLTVSDTGTGIPSSVIDKIFDPFFTTKQEGKGTGLGLSTVLGIVKNHGGAVNVYSTPKGTTFRVLLPAAPGAHQASAGADPAALPRGQGETILIVDDEQATREVAQALLAQSGYIVLTADDGPSALAIFARRSAEIRLVMTDFAMPLMSGMTLARALRKMDASTKIVISTGRDEDCNPAEAKSIGIEAVLAKPYTQEKLLRTLDRLLHAAAPGTS